MQPTLEYKYKYFTQQAYARMISRMWFQYHGHAGDERRHANCSWEEWERRKKEKEDARNT